MTERHESVLLHFFVRTFLAPFIMLFALYVLVHGEASPGGGFQGGAIFAAGVIISRLSLGLDQGSYSFLSRKTLLILACLGLGTFTFMGIAGVLFGGSFLNYGVVPLSWLDYIWPGDLGQRQMGIFIIEGGIALGVFATIILLFDFLTFETKGEDVS